MYIKEIKPITHIEFYGLPGAGKSTVSAIVAEQLGANGYIVQEPSRKINYENSIGKRRIIKLGNCISYIYKNPMQMAQIRKLVQANGYRGKNAALQAVNVIQKLKVYNEAKGKQIIIWDEGLIQAAISLAVNNKISSIKNESYMLQMCPKDLNIIRIYIKEDIVTVLKRMAHRKNGNSRVEREKNSVKKRVLLDRFEENSEEIKSDLCIYGNERSSEEIAKEILDFVCREGRLG